MAKLAIRMRGVTWPGAGGRGHPKPHMWNQRPQFVYSLYNFYGATTTIKGSLERSHCKAVLGRKFRVKSGPQNGGFSRITGVNVKFLFSNPENVSRNRVVWRITRENRFRRVGCRLLEVPPKRSRVNILMRNFAHTGKRNPLRDRAKFCVSVDTHDVITCATYCDDRLRGLGVARGRISSFPIDLRRRPYNNLALPCECVI